MTWRDTVLFLVGWTTGWVLWARVPRLPASLPTTRSGALAVIVPARDEAASLPALLASLVPQLGSADELVVVDDGSTDATAALAAAGGARVIPAPTLPVGWTGKASACHTGAAATSAPTLVFLDADVVLEPGALDRLAAAVAATPGGLVSVQPWHGMARPVEQLSVPFNMVAVAGTGLAAPGAGRRRTRVAFGPVLATARADYERVGGHAHAEVRASVVDDIALARRYDGNVRVAVDRSVASFRMYPGGFGPLLEGWTKNIATGAGYVPWWAFAATVAWLWSMIGAPAAGWPCWLASALQVYVLGRRVGAVRWWAALLAPLLAIWFLAVLARSGWRRLRGRPVRWRGRDVVV